MSEKDSKNGQNVADDPTPAVADTQAPAHLEERGLDPAVEADLEEGRERGHE
jgi:hypothetical protein